MKKFGITYSIATMKQLWKTEKVSVKYILAGSTLTHKNKTLINISVSLLHIRIDEL